MVDIPVSDVKGDLIGRVTLNEETISLFEAERVTATLYPQISHNAFTGEKLVGFSLIFEHGLPEAG